MPPITTIFTRSRHHVRHLRYLVPFTFHHHHHHKYISTSCMTPFEVPLSHPIYVIWGSNTSVGKTLVSTGLAFSILSTSSSPSKFNYIKPIQTGFPSDSDSRFLYHKLSQLFSRTKPRFSLFASNQSLKASVSAANAVSRSGSGGVEQFGLGIRDLSCYEERRIEGVEEVVGRGGRLVCKMIYGWNEAISPHLAAEREGAVVEDSVLVESLERCLKVDLEDGGSGLDGVWTVIETAGGVASPGPSGTLQCDLYRPFRLPAVLVGDGHLGGISGTISAYESLQLRGYDVVAVILEDNGLANEVPLMSYLKNRVPVLVLPPVPHDQSNNLMEWFDESQNVFHSLKETMMLAYSQRINRLQEMPKKARNIFWWPFTQHSLVPTEIVTVIDSRCGENFAVHKAKGYEAISHQFDACASWWTQGPDASLQVELARDMGYATARFGHIMFPENVYEPALKCAELLLEGVGRGWASRTFFSDNGSTAIEIALKMAFRKFSLDHGILSNLPKESIAKNILEFKVLALNGSYHGDTLGAMEAQAPSSYTGFLQQPWYSGRGLFLNPPTAFLCNECWNIFLPKVLQSEKLKLGHLTFRSRSELFNGGRDCSDLARNYSTYISEQLSLFSESSSALIGALIIEPVIQASGGMHMVDPLFQRILVKECRNRKIPVIFDEVFTGFWRLGVESASELLGCLPDIACFAKLMSGGIIPLSATLATDAVFDAFKGDSKLMALLHGHSYSAHAMGCTAAAKSIQWFKDPSTNLNITGDGKQLQELWDMELVNEISSNPSVERVVALGTLFAIELHAEGSDSGYASLFASSLIRNLREDGVYMRPLGNVVYLMCGPCTSPHVCSELLRKFNDQLHKFSQIKAKELKLSEL